MSLFAEVAGDSLRIRPHIPAHLLVAYDRLSELALRQAVIPDVVVALDERPLARVYELSAFSRGVPG